MNLWAYWFSDKMVLRMYNAQEVDEIDGAGPGTAWSGSWPTAPGLPMPRVYLIDEDQPNAFATGRNPEHAAVAATTGIMRMLTERELRGVMAHELAHVKHRDILISTISATMAGAISSLANFAMFFGGRDDEGRPANPVVSLLVMILAPLAAMLIQMAISRAREFEADRGGAEISGDPQALASALDKIHRYAQGIPMADRRGAPGDRADDDHESAVGRRRWPACSARTPIPASASPGLHAMAHGASAPDATAARSAVAQETPCSNIQLCAAAVLERYARRAQPVRSLRGGVPQASVAERPASGARCARSATRACARSGSSRRSSGSCSSPRSGTRASAASCSWRWRSCSSRGPSPTRSWITRFEPPSAWGNPRPGGWSTRCCATSCAAITTSAGRPGRPRRCATAFPAWWMQKLREQHPDHWERILVSENRHPPMTLRVNRRRTTVDAYLERLREAGIEAHPLGDMAIRIDPRPVAEVPGFYEGEVSVQDVGAQWAARLLDVADGQRVLDACAAPGGKTGHLLELAEVDLLALDSDSARLARIQENLDRLGARATLRCADAGQPDSWWDGRPFQRILARCPLQRLRGGQAAPGHPLEPPSLRSGQAGGATGRAAEWIVASP